MKTHTHVKKSYSTLLDLGYYKPILNKYLERLKDNIKYS